MNAHMIKYCLFFILLLNSIIEIGAQDVIIKKDGSIIHADIIEVDFNVVKYKKSTYPEGPVFSIYRSEIYAIAYGDNTTDYFTLENIFDKREPVEFGWELLPDTAKTEKYKTLLSFSNLMQNTEASIGIGIINMYSHAGESVENLNRKFPFPALNMRIWTALTENIYAGVQLSLAKFNYEGDDINEYDEIISLSEVKENVISLTGYGRYNFGGNLVRPYGLLGIGYTRSNIQNQRDLTFMNEGPTFRIKSNAQTVDFSILLRGGVSVWASKNFSVYSDIGSGVSLLQVGVQYKFNNN
jgi:hypothetical protein